MRYVDTKDQLIFKEYYHNEVEVNPVEPIIDKITNEYGISTTWTVGQPTVFHTFILCLY